MPRRQGGMVLAVPMRYFPRNICLHSERLFHVSRKIYLTTPIFYPNGKPHIGHAYNVIACDAMARFQRLDGKDVFFVSGTDEHGLKMQQTADAEGMTPLELADRNSSDLPLDAGSGRRVERCLYPHH